MRVLRPTRVAWRYLHTQHASQQRLELLARAFSDAVDPVERPLSDYDSRTTSNVVSSASLINGSKNGYDTNTLEIETMQFLASYQDDAKQAHEKDIEFLAQRIGFPISEAELKERAGLQLQ